ncbi:uncharacterized protein LOC134174484 isoform X2 [Pezoporus occidentalis]
MAASKQVLSLLVAALLLHMATMLKISAFNIKAFGDSKMSNQTIADIIVSILSGYDITLVQEVRDADLSAVKKLTDQLNSMSLHPYSFLDSIPLGRTSYKEQYVFIYRSDMVSVLESYYYNDSCGSGGTNAFSRDPFIVKFSSPTTREQSQCWGCLDLAQGPLCAGLMPGREVAPWSTAQRLHQGPSLQQGLLPTMGAQGSWVPAQHGQHCLLFLTMHHLPSPSSPTVCSLQLCTISHLQLFPILSHIPSPATSHLVLYPTICFLHFGVISHHVPFPIACHAPSPAIPITCHLSSCPISHLMECLTRYHHFHLPRTSQECTHSPISLPPPSPSQTHSVLEKLMGNK